MEVREANPAVAELPLHTLSAHDDTAGFELLQEAVVEHEEIDSEDPITKFLGTFLTGRQMEIVGRAKEGSLNGNVSDDRIWRRVRGGLLKHPAVVGEIALLSGYKPSQLKEPLWKEDTACKGDMRFVKQNGMAQRIKEELMDICESCPVYDNCFEDVVDNNPETGIWAGLQRSKDGKGKYRGYHDDGTPKTIQEERQAMRQAPEAKNIT